MRNTWILSIKTSLPEVCRNRGDLKTSVFAFESFEEARAALRKVLKKLAYAKNSMFDGNGNIIHFEKYVDMAYESDENEEFCDGFLVKSKLLHIYEMVRNIFKCEDVSPDFDEESYDGMIACTYKNEELNIYGDDDGPYNGYDPTIKTNMFSMKKTGNYYLYIDDAFGQNDATSELYIDLLKAEDFEG